jgi:hypothetical protein
MPAIVVALLLLGHALVHASYLAPAPAAKPGAPAWPFHLDRSWLLGPIGIDRDVSRLLGTGLVVVVVVGFALAAAACAGIGPAALWRVGVALGAVASLAVLALYFHPWLLLGVAIDLALLWFVVIGGWSPAGIGT